MSAACVPGLVEFQSKYMNSTKLRCLLTAAAQDTKWLLCGSKLHTDANYMKMKVHVHVCFLRAPHIPSKLVVYPLY